MIVGLPGVLLALLMILTVREPERKGLKMDANGVAVKASFKILWVLSKPIKTFFCHFIGFSFYTMMLYSLLGWAPAYYMRHFALDASQTGYILGSIILVANTSGALFCGWLIDFFSKRGYSDAAIRAGAIGCAALIIPSAVYSGQQYAAFIRIDLRRDVLLHLPDSGISRCYPDADTEPVALSGISKIPDFNLIALGVGTTAVALITTVIMKIP